MPNSTLAENVAEALRHAIFQGAYISGERLVELTIAQEMNVSQNTVRDALRLLERDGLVVKRSHIGTRVRAYSSEEARELYTQWATQEPLALGWALNRISRAQLDDLSALTNAMRAAVSNRHPSEVQEKRFQFHTLLVQVSGKPQTIAMLHNLRNQIRLLENLRQSMTPRSLQQYVLMLAHYDALIEALHVHNLEQGQARLKAIIEEDAQAFA